MQFPSWGNRLVYGWLVSHGIRVQFERVREDVVVRKFDTNIPPYISKGTKMADTSSTFFQ